MGFGLKALGSGMWGEGTSTALNHQPAIIDGLGFRVPRNS